VLVFRPPAGPPFEIDLRSEPSPALAKELASRGLTGPFAVITAYNPVGHPVEDDANQRRDRALAERLAALGVVVIPVDGRSPDGRHVEPGYGVPLPPHEACGLAREFGQTAIFWWNGEAFWLVEARKGGRCVRLPE
jgi:hypothetical protein